MHAHIFESCFGKLFVSGVHQFFVVHQPRVFGEVLVGVVANGVTLHGVGLEQFNGLVNFFHPTGIAWGENGVRHRPLAACNGVDGGFAAHFHFVGQEPVARNFRGCAADTGHLGVAVEVNFFEVVCKLQVVNGLRAGFDGGVPACFAHGFALQNEGLNARVVAQKVGVHVHDELTRELFGAFIGHVRSLGFCFGNTKNRAVGVVHGYKSGGHAGGALEKLAARGAQFFGHFGADGFDSGFVLFLLGRLARRHELIAGHALHRNGRGKERSLCPVQFGQFVVS